MKFNILLLSKDENLMQHLKKVIDLDVYDLHQTSVSDIMQKCFMLSPYYILVDMKDLTLQITQVMKSIQELVYIPTLYIGDKKRLTFTDDSWDQALVISEDQLLHQIENLLTQVVQFKNQYDQVSNTFDTMDGLTTDTKRIMAQFIDEEIELSSLYGEVFNSVFKFNPILNNKPKQIWILVNEKIKYKGILYDHIQGSDSYEKIYECELPGDINFGFDIFAENGFKVNLMAEKLSDIDAEALIFPDVMASAMTEFQNFAGYGMDQIIVVGCNYKNEVTSYEASILKSATVTLDLLEHIQTQIAEVEGAFNYTLDALARAAEASDDTTGHHIRRVNEYARFIASTMNLDSVYIKELGNSAQMHDVGKIYVDNQILKKQGPLTSDEFDEMKKHTSYGELIVGHSSYLKMASEIALNHHEKYDGSGYPNGKMGAEIPLSARIVALADIYDALRSPRSYKPGFSHEKAFDIITNGDGRVEPKHFDPEVLEVFEKHHLVFDQIYSVYSSDT